jgi:hypothetical protein
MKTRMTYVEAFLDNFEEIAQNKVWTAQTGAAQRAVSEMSGEDRTRPKIQNWTQETIL